MTTPVRAGAAALALFLACAALADDAPVRLAAADGRGSDALGSAIAASGATLLAGAPGHDDGGADAGAVFVFVPCGGAWTQTAEIHSEVTGPGGHFGSAIALDGERAAIGAPDSPSGGIVAVHERIRGVWTMTAALVPASLSAGDRFGAAVAVQGDRVVVGAPGKDGGTGAVYVFDRGAGGWTQTARLVPSGIAPGGTGERFGSAVALDGSTIAASAPGLSKTFVFTLAATTWSEQAAILPAGHDGTDVFAWSLALAGDRLALGAPGDDLRGADAGAALVYARSGTTWSLDARIEAPSPSAGDAFGSAVALTTSKLSVGSPGASSSAGRVDVFVRGASAWSFESARSAPGAAASERYGAGLAASGDDVFTAAPGVGGDVGAVWTPPLAPLWSQAGRVVPSDITTGDQFGTTAVFDGARALVASPLKSGAAGAAYVFVRSGSTLAQEAKLAPTGVAAGDRFGERLAMSGDTAVVASFRHAGLDGAAWVFVRTGSTWYEQAVLKEPDGLTGTFFGASAAVSGDTIAIGASGAVHVFVRSGALWTRQAKLTAAAYGLSGPFSSPIAIDGDRIVVGGTLPDPTPGDGLVPTVLHVFERTGTSWAHAAAIVPPVDRYMYGNDVALRGDVIVAADAQGSPSPAPHSGVVFVYERSGAAWTLSQEIRAAVPHDDDQFGLSLAFDGTTIVVGSPTQFAATRAGTAYAFRRRAGRFTQVAQMQSAETPDLGAFGTAVGVAGEEVVVTSLEPVGSVLTGAAYLLTIPEPAGFAIGPGGPPSTTSVGAPYDAVVPVSNGTPSFQWFIQSGELPPGLALGARSGRVTGPATQAGDFAFTVGCAEACGEVATAAYAIRVEAGPAILTTSLPPAVEGLGYVARLQRGGGAGIFTWTLGDDGGTGLAMDAGTGVISGVAPVAGRYSLVVRGVDGSDAVAAPVTLTLTVGPRVRVGTGATQFHPPTNAASFVVAIDLLGSSAVNVTATAPRGGTAPAIRLLEKSGKPLDVAASLRVGRRTTSIRRQIVPASGLYLVEITPASASSSAGTRVSVSAAAPRVVQQTMQLVTGLTSEFRVPLLAGGRAKVTVTANAGDPVLPAIYEIFAADGAPIPIVGGDTDHASAAAFRATGAGDVSVRLVTRNGTSGTAVARARLVQPRRYEYSAGDVVVGGM